MTGSGNWTYLHHFKNKITSLQDVAAQKLLKTVPNMGLTHGALMLKMAVLQNKGNSGFKIIFFQLCSKRFHRAAVRPGKQGRDWRVCKQQYPPLTIPSTPHCCVITIFSKQMHFEVNIDFGSMLVPCFLSYILQPTTYPKKIN